MIRGAFIGIGVTLLLLMIPLVHFVLGPPGPFIGGFIGGSKAEASPRQALLLGLLMGLLMGAPVGLVLLVNSMVPTLLPAGLREVLLLLAVGVMGYTGTLGTLGALVGGRMVRRERAQREEVESPAM